MWWTYLLGALAAVRGELVAVSGAALAAPPADPTAAQQHRGRFLRGAVTLWQQSRRVATLAGWYALLARFSEFASAWILAALQIGANGSEGLVLFLAIPLGVAVLSESLSRGSLVVFFGHAFWLSVIAATDTPWPLVVCLSLLAVAKTYAVLWVFAWGVWVGTEWKPHQQAWKIAWQWAWVVGVCAGGGAAAAWMSDRFGGGIRWDWFWVGDAAGGVLACEWLRRRTPRWLYPRCAPEWFPSVRGGWEALRHGLTLDGPPEVRGHVHGLRPDEFCAACERVLRSLLRRFVRRHEFVDGFPLRAKRISERRVRRALRRAIADASGRLSPLWRRERLTPETYENELRKLAEDYLRFADEEGDEEGDAEGDADAGVDAGAD